MPDDNLGTYGASPVPPGASGNSAQAPLDALRAWLRAIHDAAGTYASMERAAGELTGRAYQNSRPGETAKAWCTRRDGRGIPPGDVVVALQQRWPSIRLTDYVLAAPATESSADPDSLRDEVARLTAVVDALAALAIERHGDRFHALLANAPRLGVAPPADQPVNGSP